MGTIFSMADVLLVHLKDDPLFEITILSKTQAYLAAEKPILMAVKGDAGKIVEMANAGLQCSPENSESIASSVISFVNMTETQRNQMGINGKKFYEQYMSLQVGTQLFEKLFRLVSRKS